VAVHTHGDLSSRGIIAVAVFVEGHVEPARLNTPVVNHNHYHYPRARRDYPHWDYYYGGYYTLGTNITNTTDSISFNSANVYNGSDSLRSVQSVNTCSVQPAAASMDANYFSGGNESSSATGHAKSLETLVAIGAGQHVDQKINYVQGLIKPLFTESVRVRYMWWDDLVAKLRENNVAEPHASGFPGDKGKKNIDLGGTPRIGGYQKDSFPRSQQAPVYSRV
jgi:hypothetical protein